MSTVHVPLFLINVYTCIIFYTFICILAIIFCHELDVLKNIISNIILLQFKNDHG